MLSKSLAFLTSIYVGAIFSISKPLTYALPEDTCSERRSSPAVLPWLVIAPEPYTPVKISAPTLWFADSFTWKVNGRTV